MHGEISCKVDSRFGKLASNLSLRGGGLSIFESREPSSPKLGLVSLAKMWKLRTNMPYSDTKLLRLVCLPGVPASSSKSLPSLGLKSGV